MLEKKGRHVGNNERSFKLNLDFRLIRIRNFKYE